MRHVLRLVRIGLVLLAAACKESAGPSGPARPPTVGGGSPGPAGVASVSVQFTIPLLQVGTSTQAFVTVRDAAGTTLTDRPVSWTTSNGAVAFVDAGGRVTGVTPGTVTITATSEGRAGSATLAVAAVAVAQVQVLLEASSVPAGTTTQARTLLRDYTNTLITNRPVAWSSTNVAVATVDAAGVVQGVAPGTTTIIASADGRTGSATLTVTPAAPTVSVVPLSGQDARCAVRTDTCTFRVAVREATGRGVVGLPVEWTLAGITTPPVVTVTDSSGVAGAPVVSTLLAPGPYEQIASVTGPGSAQPVSIRFRFQVEAAPLPAGTQRLAFAPRTGLSVTDLPEDLATSSEVGIGAGAAAAYDPLSDRVLVYGGTGHVGTRAIVAYRDGTRVPGPLPPAVRHETSSAMMAFDPTRGTVLLALGTVVGPNARPGIATYEIRGDSTVLRDELELPTNGLGFSVLFFDPTVRAMLWFDVGTTQSTLRAWTGSTWSFLRTIPSPAVGRLVGWRVAYDPGRRRVLFWERSLGASEFDLARGVWEPGNPLRIPYAEGASFSWDETARCLLVAGGHNPEHDPINTVACISTTQSDTTTRVTPGLLAPRPYYGSVAVYDSRRRHHVIPTPGYPRAGIFSGPFVTPTPRSVPYPGRVPLLDRRTPPPLYQPFPRPLRIDVRPERVDGAVAFRPTGGFIDTLSSVRVGTRDPSQGWAFRTPSQVKSFTREAPNGPSDCGAAQAGGPVARFWGPAGTLWDWASTVQGGNPAVWGEADGTVVLEPGVCLVIPVPTNNQRETPTSATRSLQVTPRPLEIATRPGQATEGYVEVIDSRVAALFSAGAQLSATTPALAPCQGPCVRLARGRIEIVSPTLARVYYVATASTNATVGMRTTLDVTVSVMNAVTLAGVPSTWAPVSLQVQAVVR